jgi:hypothetical protein
MAASVAAVKAGGKGISAALEGDDEPDEVEVAVPVTSSGSHQHLTTQEKVHKFYNSNSVQVCVAGIIVANFLTNIVEKQIDPEGTEYKTVFSAFELAYNIAFTVELIVNMYAHWLQPFWRSGWNVFDVVVVTIGVVNTLKLPLPKAFSLLRMMRAFRVFRLFKRVKSLNKIIVAILHAVPGVANAFLILTIVMCIYAILAVEFYKEVGVGCESPGYDREGFSTRRATSEGGCMGHEYFGTFGKSIFTFFQVLTGESWSENVARPVIWYYEDKFLSLSSALFFVSFVLVTGFVLTNVVVAVLLDKMTANEEAVEEVPSEAAPEEPVTEHLARTLTADEKFVAKQIGKLQGTVGQLGSGAVTLQADFDRAKADVVEISQQLTVLSKALERKYRLAVL